VLNAVSGLGGSSFTFGKSVNRNRGGEAQAGVCVTPAALDDYLGQSHCTQLAPVSQSVSPICLQ
jgi:hypothetical protein